MGERIGDDEILVEFGFDRVGERVRRRHEKGPPRLALGIGEPPNHEE